MAMSSSCLELGANSVVEAAYYRVCGVEAMARGEVRVVAGHISQVEVMPTVGLRKTF